MNATLSEVVYKTIFPPDGAIPLKAKRNIQAIDARIKEIEELSTGKAIEGMTRRIADLSESKHLTEQIVRLRDSCNPPMSYREIMKHLGHVITPDAARNRYDDYKQKLLKVEAYTAMSGKTDMLDQLVEPNEMILAELKPVEKAEPVQAATESKQKSKTVPLQEAKSEQPETSTTRNLRTIEELTTVPAGEDDSVQEPVIIEVPPEQPNIAAPDKSPGLKIPHEEDEWLWKQIEAKTARRDILAELQKRRPKCSYADLNYRLQWLRDKREDKKRVTDKTAKEIGQEKWIESAEAKPPTNPEPKAIGRAELDAKIWGLWTAGKTPKAISDDLCSEGYYYGEQRVRLMLLQQGADL
jgi:hypothetical protein